MKTNNSLVQPGSTPISQLTINEADNAMDQELNDSELDAIAGGMETITVPGATPYLPRISVSLLNYLTSYYK